MCMPVFTGRFLGNIGGVEMCGEGLVEVLVRGECIRPSMFAREVGVGIEVADGWVNSLCCGKRMRSTLRVEGEAFGRLLSLVCVLQLRKRRFPLRQAGCNGLLHVGCLQHGHIPH